MDCAGSRQMTQDNKYPKSTENASVLWTIWDCVGKRNGDPYGIRTRIAAVKGRCPNH